MPKIQADAYIKICTRTWYDNYEGGQLLCVMSAACSCWPHYQGEFVHSRVDQIPAGLTVVIPSRDRRSERVHGGANSRRNGTGLNKVCFRAKITEQAHQAIALAKIMVHTCVLRAF